MALFVCARVFGFVRVCRQCCFALCSLFARVVVFVAVLEFVFLFVCVGRAFLFVCFCV